MIDTIVSGGMVVFPDSIRELDIAIDGERIVALGEPSFMPQAKRVISAAGCYVIPGGIDPHVHVCWPFLDETTADDFRVASIAAAIGGTTTMIDWAHPKMGPSPTSQVAYRRSQADGQVAIDYGLHSVLVDGSASTCEEMKTLVEDGITSFKLYMTYSRRGIMADDATMFSVMQHATSLGATVMVHAENGTISDWIEESLVSNGKTAATDFPLNKPSYVEAEAVNRAIFWAKQTGVQLYIVHLSTADGLALVRAAQEDGVDVIAETCPQYLLLDESVFARSDGHRFICSPPIRSAEDSQSLWKGIADSVILTTGTDHCAFTASQKDQGYDDFRRVPNGLPGVETRLPLLFSEGVMKGRISATTLARVTSLEPAKVFGLFPKKGILAPGSDADIVMIDPAREKVISSESLNMGVDWTPFDGWQVEGFPVLTISRGEVIVEDGEFIGKAGRGRFVPRQPRSRKTP
jgi:dihydropyrimidinase